MFLLLVLFLQLEARVGVLNACLDLPKLRYEFFLIDVGLLEVLDEGVEVGLQLIVATKQFGHLLLLLGDFEHVGSLLVDGLQLFFGLLSRRSTGIF